MNMNSTLKASTFLLITVNLFGLYEAGLLPWKLGYCKQLGIGYELDVKKFFTGKWYTQFSYGNVLSQWDGICPGVESRLNSDGTIDVLNFKYEPFLLHNWITIKGNTSIEAMKNVTPDNIGEIPITYSEFFGLKHKTVPLFVVETDYDNFVILYTCKQHLIYKSESSWILTRSREIDSDTSIENTLTKYGLSLKDYRKQTTTGCPTSDEPHL